MVEVIRSPRIEAYKDLIMSTLNPCGMGCYLVSLPEFVSRDFLNVALKAIQDSLNGGDGIYHNPVKRKGKGN